MSKQRKKRESKAPTDAPKPVAPEPLIKTQNPVVTEQNASPLTTVKIALTRPVLGMSLMKITGSYSLQAIHDRNPDKRRENYRELEHLQRELIKFKTIDDFLEHFTPRHGEVSPENNPDLKKELERVKKLLGSSGLDSNSINIRHIHSRAKGKGKFTLFGFQYENVFEILLLDPEHEIL